MSVQEGLDRVKLNLIQGRRVILTGASSGIGEALASRLLELEANVLVTARRESPDQTEREVPAAGALGQRGYHCPLNTPTSD